MEKHEIETLKETEQSMIEKELRELSGEEDKNGGFAWTVTVPISIAICPTGKCTKSCR